MKKTFQILGAAMLALAVVGCENEPIDEGNTPVTPDEPVVEEPAEPAELVLCATLPETRTALDTETFKVSWAAVDELAVFNAPTGTDEYSANLHFITKVEGEGEEATAQLGVFVPAEGVEVPFEDGVNYDWYVLHPWRSTGGDVEMKTPKGESKEDGYFPIGAQTQTGYNNAIHVSGSDPLVGKVANTREPNVTLKHLAVLHKFTVTNNSDKPTVITKLTLNGGENKLFGTFWIDLTADEPAIDINKANNTFNERSLTVKNGTELAVGESADFYMITAPFTLATGETFKVTIETSTGTQVIEKTATEDIEFKAGTYNTANLVYDYVYVEEAKPIFLETFGTSTPYSNTIITYNNDNSGIAATWSNGTGVDASGYTTGGAFEGVAMRWSSAKANSNTKWTGVSVNGNATLTVSYDLVLTGDAGTTIAFSHRNTGSTKWIKVHTTELTVEEKGTIKHISFDITIADPTKTIEFYLSSTTATQYAWLDNLKLDVPEE